VGGSWACPRVGLVWGVGSFSRGAGAVPSPFRFYRFAGSDGAFGWFRRVRRDRRIGSQEKTAAGCPPSTLGSSRTAGAPVVWAEGSCVVGNQGCWSCLGRCWRGSPGAWSFGGVGERQRRSTPTCGRLVLLLARELEAVSRRFRVPKLAGALVSISGRTEEAAQSVLGASGQWVGIHRVFRWGCCGCGWS